MLSARNRDLTVILLKNIFQILFLLCVSQKLLLHIKVISKPRL